MAESPAQQVVKSPAAPSVRGFLNLAAALPDFGAEAVKDIAAVSKDGGKGLLYGQGNTVPVVALAAALASGTAYRCLERRAQLLEGTGFPAPKRNPETGLLVDEAAAGTLGDAPVPGHVGKTANDLWAELCSYGSYFNGAAVLVRYNNGNTIGEIHVLPFGSVRKTTAGTYLLNHKFGRKGFKADATTEHLPFNPDKKVVLELLRQAKEINPKTKKPYGQPGQIFYIYNPSAGQEDYPLPPHWSGLETVLADAEYSNYELGEVRRGFRGKGVLVLLGEENNTLVGEDGLTDQERQDEQLRRYTVAGAAEQGVELETILVMSVKNKEAAPIWIPMATTMDLKWLSEKKEAVGQEVCRHIGIPPIVAGFAKSGQLGNVGELMNAYQLTQDSLEPLRRCLLRAFWRLMPALNGIVPGQRTPVLTQSTTEAPATTNA